ncbi:MAG TPA: hypothetical protein VFR17_13145 [Mycobacterium sp.]|nr:hypothetical protein [Mycobacterium sp.]
MAPSSVRMVLVEGDHADGVTIDQDGFDVSDVEADGGMSRQVVSAILGTRESADESGYRLTSTGVVVGDQAQGQAVRQALTESGIDGVTLVSAFLAAAALTQTVGGAIGYERTALLFVEPDSATLSVVDSADGSIAEVRRTELPADDESALAALTAMVAQVAALPSSPDGVFVVGSGVEVGMIKAPLEAASPLPLSVPEEPDAALARGAALASAHAVLFDSSTSALAWARDPGTGTIDPSLVALSYADVSRLPADPDATVGEQALAYSAVGDNDPDSGYLTIPDREFPDGDAADLYYADSLPPPAEDTGSGRKPFLLAGSSLAALFVVGVASLVVALAIGIRPTAATQPDPGNHIIVPQQQAPPPVPEVQPAAPAPAPAAPAPAPPPAAPAPAPAAPAPAPAAPAPAPAAPTPAPAAPAPAPAAPAPIPIPIPIEVPAPVAPAPVAPAPQAPAPAQVPSLPSLVPSSVPKAPKPTQPPVVSPPKNSGGDSGGLPNGKPGGGGWPGLPDNSGGRGGGGWPGLPDNGGGRGGGAPLSPGNGGGHGGGQPLFPGFPGHDSGGGGGGGGTPLFPGFPGGGGNSNGGGWGNWGNWFGGGGHEGWGGGGGHSGWGGGGGHGGGGHGGWGGGHDGS